MMEAVWRGSPSYWKRFSCAAVCGWWGVCVPCRIQIKTVNIFQLKINGTTLNNLTKGQATDSNYISYEICIRLKLKKKEERHSMTPCTQDKTQCGLNTCLSWYFVTNCYNTSPCSSECSLLYGWLIIAHNNKSRNQQTWRPIAYLLS